MELFASLGGVGGRGPGTYLCGLGSDFFVEDGWLELTPAGGATPGLQRQREVHLPERCGTSDRLGVLRGLHAQTDVASVPCRWSGPNWRLLFPKGTGSYTGVGLSGLSRGWGLHRRVLLSGR